jgi:hypothetical protein
VAETVGASFGAELVFPETAWAWLVRTHSKDGSRKISVEARVQIIGFKVTPHKGLRPPEIVVVVVVQLDVVLHHHGLDECVAAL